MKQEQLAFFSSSTQPKGQIATPSKRVLLNASLTVHGAITTTALITAEFAWRQHTQDQQHR